MHMAWGAADSSETSDSTERANGGQAMSAAQVETSRRFRACHQPRWSTGYVEVDPKFCEACGECAEVCRSGDLRLEPEGLADYSVSEQSVDLFLQVQELST